MIFSVVGISIVSVMICLLLRKTNPEFSLVVALISGIFIFSIIILHLTPILSTLENYAADMNLNNVYFVAVIKALGICYIVQLASDTCRDAGYTAIASKIELAGKIAILVIALPLFENLLNIAKGLLNLGS